jgi:hypothetical protein
MKLKELSIRIKPSKEIKGYDAVNIKINIDGQELESNELIRENDFESRFDFFLSTVKKEVIRLVKEREDDYV